MTRTPLLIVGDSSFAEIAHVYFGRDTDYEPVAFVVEDAYRTKEELAGLPVVPMSEVEHRFPAAETSFYTAIVYTQLNRLRARLYADMKSRGYAPASYVSEHAYIDSSATLGEHVFIFEDNTVQPFVTVEDNVVLWSGNHIGHHTTIARDVFISSHVVVSGHCTIGAASFLGVNSSIGNNVDLGEDNWLMPGVNILKSTEPNQFWRPEKPVLGGKTPHQLFLS
jgi:sugar O-acyltransferase (sialic acid O-acetyltransferase NeuD family)